MQGMRGGATGAREWDMIGVTARHMMKATEIATTKRIPLWDEVDAGHTQKREALMRKTKGGLIRIGRTCFGDIEWSFVQGESPSPLPAKVLGDYGLPPVMPIFRE
ncbi:hypothetical protein PIB30_041951 [Stylosanthes scabra]|uniref:Uncharacterized protein n=1 Tax=Stylosanthes scabra TaxID=79078 RepID=A0ABU6TEQ0_9FABA|nr:hypothetical protein [Stylosanthes scabra]